MTAKTTDKPSLEVIRVINAPRDRVYAAWTDPAQLRQWFGPENTATYELVADARAGGDFRWETEDREGERMTASGEYLELVPNRKVVFTWQWQDDDDWAAIRSIVMVELADVDGGTEVRLRHEQLPSEASRDRHTEGWTSLLAQLEKFVAR